MLITSPAKLVPFALLVALATTATICAAEVPVPELISPAEGAVLDNGRTDRLDAVVWDFDWTDCEGASFYHLHVQHVEATNPVISNPFLTESSYHHEASGAYITDFNRFDWLWAVRAQVDGVWGEWSPVRTFDVEPVNSDPPVIFPDVPSEHWACWEIGAIHLAGITSGYPDGLYHPEREVDRGQMTVYIARALAGGEEHVPAPTADPGFTDVDSEHWAYKYICYAVDQHIVIGYPEGDYKPAESVTRDQMAVYIARAMVAPTTSVLDTYEPADPRNFPDVPSTHWAYPYVEYCVEQGVVSGYPEGDYKPAVVVTRDQMAVYVARAFELVL